MSEEILDSLLKENSRVPRKGSGVGVINVHKRIQIRFGKKYGLEIESEPDEGTMVRIRLPYIEYSPEILEYLDGKLSIHEGKEYQVMTNSPRYEYS